MSAAMIDEKDESVCYDLGKFIKVCTMQLDTPTLMVGFPHR